MTKIVPTIGRIVYFTLAPWQAEQINKRREDTARCIDYHRWKSNGSQVHVGTSVQGGQVCAAMIVAVWGDQPESAVNLKVMLDGSDDYWVTSTSVEDERADKDGKPVHTPGRYHWMPYQVGQAAKHASTPLGMMRNAAGDLHPIPETLC